MSNNKMLDVVVVAAMISTFVASLGSIVLLIQNNVSREITTTRASKERAEIRKHNDFLVCILETQPADRSKQAIQNCKDQTINK